MKLPKLALPTRRPHALPSRSELDQRQPRRTAGIAIALSGATLALGATWWARNGSALLNDLAFNLETFYLYWTLVASPLDRKVWTFIAIGILATLILILLLARRFIWRALFPDLVRLEPRAHPGGRPERVGRLYRVRKFQDDKTERLYHRHYYKHGDRWFPLFRFDHVDLEKPAEPHVFGVSLIRCGRLERDPNGSRFKRIAAEGPIASQPLETTFRESEVTDDQLRKTSIVGPGPGMNPDVMRRKWQTEPSMIPRLEQQSRTLLTPRGDTPDPRIAPAPPEDDA